MAPVLTDRSIIAKNISPSIGFIETLPSKFIALVSENDSFAIEEVIPKLFCFIIENVPCVGLVEVSIEAVYCNIRLPRLGVSP